MLLELFYNDRTEKNCLRKVKGAILCVAIGDAIGVPFEFNKRYTFTTNGMEGYKVHYQPAGTWSDDTAFTLCTIENIIKNGDRESLMNKFILCKECGYFAPREKLFDIGNCCLRALYNYMNFKDINNCGEKDEYSNGNGALMRVAPLAIPLLSENNINNRYIYEKKYTEITHAHPRAIVGSIIYIELLINLYKLNSLEESLINVRNTLNSMNLTEYERKEIKEYEIIFNKNFKDIDIDEIKSSGYVVDTLTASIWCILNSNNFKEAVLKAVNLGGDTDTVGSTTGTIAGVILGYRKIPKEWISNLYDSSRINKMADLLYSKINEIELNL